MQHPITVLAECIQDEQRAALATVIKVEGASPAKVGAQIVLLSDGTSVGTVGGGKLEASILKDAENVLSEGTSSLNHYTLTEKGTNAVGSLCGGEIHVFIQSYHPPPKLIIVGGGHIGAPLKVMAEAAGFKVVVVDAYPGKGEVSELKTNAIDENTFIVLLTTDHVSDEAALRQVVNSSTRYIGMIGSRAKCQTILDHLQKEGFTQDVLLKVYAPIGLNLGGSTPQEIAVAILAEIIAVRYEVRKFVHRTNG